MNRIEHHKPSPPTLVGGSGKRKARKLVAKYADACNLVGSIETIKRIVDVLKEHCQSINSPNNKYFGRRGYS